MESFFTILLNMIGGGTGGWLGSMFKKNELGMTGNVLVGAVGGNALNFFLTMFDGADGGSSSMLLKSITAMIGGIAGTVIVGSFNKT